MLLNPSNLLLLDEPTNHLDLDSKEVLLDALADYGGTLIFVSHDRYFVDRLATKVIEVGGGEAPLYPGGYEDFLYWKKQREAGLAAPLPKPTVRHSIDDEAGRRRPRSPRLPRPSRASAAARPQGPRSPQVATAAVAKPGTATASPRRGEAAATIPWPRACARRRRRRPPGAPGPRQASSRR